MSLNADPEKGRNTWRKNAREGEKNLEAGKKKGINELSERQQRLKRRKWRAAYKRSKERREALKNLTTPPQSPDHAPEKYTCPGSSR